MYSVKFFLRSPNGVTETPINLFINYDGRRIKTPTGLKIHPDLWNPEDQVPSSAARIILKYNQIYPGIESRLRIIKGKLAELRKAVDDYFSLSHINETDINLDDLQYKIQSMIKPKHVKPVSRDRVCLFLEEFIAEAESGRRKLNGKNYTTGTIKNYRNLLQSLKRFQRVFGKEIRWDMITKSLYAQFMEWQSSQNFSINYSGKHAKDLKSIMRVSYEEGLHHNESFRSKWFAVPSERKEKYPLSAEDMQRLFDLQLEEGSLKSKARDAFLIGCYTGLRVSDIQKINKTMLTITKDGRKRIKITTQKNNKPVVIPISSQLDVILNRYDYNSPNFVGQTVNRLIKNIAINAGIDVIKASQLSFHIGRHSFATHLYTIEGLPERDIMQVTGHTTERNFMRYINVKPDEAASRMEKYNFFK